MLVAGGGKTAREYQAALSKFGANNSDLDWIGIHSTILNAQFLIQLFKGYAHTSWAGDPEKKIKTNKPILVGAGWEPGASSDYDSVLLAKTYGAKELINLSNIDYVYDSDPKKNKKAKKLSEVSWAEVKKIVGSKWVPGANVPFDPKAARAALKLGLTVKFAKGTNLKEVKKALTGKPFRGTVIS